MSKFRISVEIDPKSRKLLHRVISLLPGKVIDPSVESGIKAGAKLIQKRAQMNIEKKLNKHPTGKLRDSIAIEIEKSGRDTKATIGTDVIYSRIHEKGGIIRPVKAKMLAWQGEDGKMIFAKQVRIPARPYLEPATKQSPGEVLGTIGQIIRDHISESIRRIIR